MAITLTIPMDELDLLSKIDAGWTTLKLYYSNTPEGPYADTLITPSPSTLSALYAAGDPFLSTFIYPSGNAGQWFKIVGYTGSVLSDINDSQAFHGGGGTTMEVVRQKIGKITNSMHLGTTTSNGASDGSTAICASAYFKRFRNDYFGGNSDVDGWMFYNNTADSWTNITDWVQSTGTFTLSPVMASQVNSGVNFEVWTRWTPDEVRDAINWAISNSYPTLCKTVVDTATVTEEDIFVYSIPNSIRILNSVEMDSSSDPDSEDSRTRGMPWRELPFTEIIDGLQKNVEFKRELVEGRRLRFTGTAILNFVYSDSDLIEVIDPQTDLLVYLAAHRLYSLLANTDAASDIDRFRAQADYFLNLYEKNRTKHGTRRKPKKFWAHDSKWSIL